MTLPKNAAACPLCAKTMASVAKHLRVVHRVASVRERVVLTKLATGRIDIRKCPCPVPACSFRGHKLDRHLVRSHVELTQKQRQAYSHRAKREEAIAQLGQLRASDPAVPMVSQLDLQASEGGPAEREVAEDGGCQNPACDRQRQDLEDKVSRLEKELRALRRCFRRYVRRRVVREAAAGTEEEAAETEEQEEAAETEEKEEAAETEEEAGPSPAKRMKWPQRSGEKEKEKEGEPGSAQRKLSFGSGSGKGSTVRFIRFPASVVEGQPDKGLPGLEFMSAGQTDLWTWSFLCQPQRILEWAGHIQQGGLQVTTARFYLINVRNFVEYMKETPPANARLNSAQLTVVLRTVKQALLTMSRKVVLRQLAVKASKVSKVVAKDTLQDIKTAPLTHLAVRTRFYGYLAAFLQSLYGHRSGVLTNMTVPEVLQAEGDETIGYVINVNQHKTNRQFGAAQIYLEPDEYEWMRTWVDLRKTRAPMNNLFFSMTGMGPAKSLLKFFKQVWAEMGLPGKPTFTDIRTAVATHNHTVNDPEVRKMVAEYMCHDLTTQNRFYALHHGVREAKTRRIFTKASRTRFYGYLAAFLQSLYGHRSGVLTNMTVPEVLQAEGDETIGYVINVNQHKTNRQFGAAQIYLEPDEYEWMRTWVDLRKTRAPMNNYSSQ
ncbi:hypothetical protein SKAU_G00414200 [Synaphobranchus kaupii]|uniref:Uncharacterized protein n=1 Tax=Synaphobranchus kaupii TaxID=118154 RepID=A0A9Q1E755_SYNKA|nr:hypothetical protein SKAU_G00414200 [Synaphobranchus kaupii]